MCTFIRRVKAHTRRGKESEYTREKKRRKKEKYKRERKNERESSNGHNILARSSIPYKRQEKKKRRKKIK